MRPTRATVLFATGLVALLGTPAAIAAEPPSTLYVNSREGSNCTDSGPGSQTVPYCTISAAAKVAGPGQTVRIGMGVYPEALNLDRSGTPGKPIVFDAELADRMPAISVKSLTITGASHLVVRGLRPSTVRVSGSADIELDRLRASGGRVPGVIIGGASTDVRLTRSHASDVRIEGGSQRTLLGRNELLGHDGPPVTAQDAPGTVITNNRLVNDCFAAASVTGTSTGSALFNNVVYAYRTASACPDGAPATGIEVAPTAASGTRADYNLLVDGETSWLTAYKWAGTVYETAAALKAATGQGEHDLLVPSAMLVVDGNDGSPIIDSGDPTAPGVLPTDERGFPTADDPRQPNTGKDGGYIDRGNRETQDWLSRASVEIEENWAPVGTTVTAKVVTDSRWGGLTYTYDFGDGTDPVISKDRTATHVYAKPCECTVKVTAATGVGVTATAEATTKVTATGPLTAGFTTRAVLPESDNPIGYTRPLTYEFDPRPATAAPWPVQRVDVDFGDGTYAHGDHMDSAYIHTYDRPGDYKVTFTLGDKKGAVNTVTRTVRAEYAPSGYAAVEPFRLLDTRAGGSLQAGNPTSVVLPVGLADPKHPLSGSMAAAVLNVTVTDATQDTHLSVWPSGQPRPITSNVNIKAGGTASNTVTVPVGADGKVLAQLNSGKAALIVDFVGYYQPNSGRRFTPQNPARVLDTRTAGGKLGGGQTRTVKVAGVGGIPADATAVTFNLTSTGTTENTHVIAYPDPARRTATSNLNPEPGVDKSNQAIVPVGPDGTITLYNNAGATDLVLDAVGYYAQDGKALFTPVVPTRLADTRTTGKIAPGAATTVAGIPANALGAVVNITATDTTGAGFLTAHADGTARPEASSLSTRPGVTVPNHVTTPAAGGRIAIWNSWGGSNHVITDLLGYFTQN
ncbi:PKD domain-containing protein [Streptomyces erythrochromogenes]|uniref:PKD domain-containing protein n=1 Tax=Streptomyces erythrochromogenes TaxID=285574 RepID=UPI0036A67E57